jgi:CRP/FNR family transcriptional regulator, anaerobic regulatory protein
MPNRLANTQDSANLERQAKEHKLLVRLPIQKRVVRAGEVLLRSGQALGQVYIVETGMFKTVQRTADGREQVVALHFKGDWLGFDALADGRHRCETVALDTGCVLALPYATLLSEAVAQPELLHLMHRAMGRQHSRDRDNLLSLCTLSADARVADFLHQWACAQAQAGLRDDQIRLRMTRAEIGQHLGLTLETVSRALSKLARQDLIRFGSANARRDIHIPELDALAEFVHQSGGEAVASSALAH